MRCGGLTARFRVLRILCIEIVSYKIPGSRTSCPHFNRVPETCGQDIRDPGNTFDKFLTTETKYDP